MSLVLFDHRCERCEHVFEELVERDSPCLVTCPSCGYVHQAKRLIGTFHIDPSLGVDAAGFPTMGDKWIKRRQEHQRIEERRKREHGD